MIKVYFDGACEPVNPGGTAAYGVVIQRVDGFPQGSKLSLAEVTVELFRESKIFVPQKGKEKETSNNVAEYSGFLRALEWLYDNGLHDAEIKVFGDSQLVIYQNWEDPRYEKKWQMRGGHYIKVARQAVEMLKKFTNISGEWIPREQNNLADELSKKSLIEHGVSFRIQPLKNKVKKELDFTKKMYTEEYMLAQLTNNRCQMAEHCFDLLAQYFILSDPKKSEEALNKLSRYLKRNMKRK